MKKIYTEPFKYDALDICPNCGRELVKVICDDRNGDHCENCEEVTNNETN